MIESFNNGPCEQCGSTAPGWSHIPSTGVLIAWGQHSLERVPGAPPDPQAQPGCIWAPQQPRWSRMSLLPPLNTHFLWHSVLSHPGVSIPKALVGSLCHSIQFRNCMISTCHGLGPWGNKVPSSQEVTAENKNFDNCKSVWLEGSLGTTRN